MKRLRYTRAHHASRLRAELEVAIPMLAPIVGADGQRVARLLLAGADGNTLLLTVPDEVDESLIDSVLAAHDPTPDPAPDPIVPQPGDSTGRDIATIAAESYTALRAYRARPTPTDAQRKQWEDRVSLLLMWILHERFGRS